MPGADRDFRFWPLSGHLACRSFDHLVGAGERQSRTQGRRPLVEPFCRIGVPRQRIPGWTSTASIIKPMGESRVSIAVASVPATIDTNPRKALIPEA
jgi:hypothetical protein